jgi:hypothetical protein
LIRILEQELASTFGSKGNGLLEETSGFLVIIGGCSLPGLLQQFLS